MQPRTSNELGKFEKGIPENNTWQQNRIRIILNITIIGLLILIAILLVLGIVEVKAWKHMDCAKEVNHTTNAWVDTNKTLPTTMPKFRIVARDEWIAQSPNSVLVDLVLPVERVIILYTATEGCSTLEQCIYRVRMIQTYHMESKSWDDIGYNFLVGGDGFVYMGRGWNKQGATTIGYNKGSIGIGLIGTFVKTSPPSRQFDALRLLLDEGVRLGKLTDDYKMYPRHAFYRTESPGDKVVEVIKNWPHYVDSINGVGK